MSDQDLLRAVARGEREAFGEFYERHAPRVLALLRRWLAQHDDADDVLQEVFWQVWQRAAQYDAALSPPEVWLLLIARSRAVDHLRRCKPRGAAGETPVTDPACDPARLLEQQESAEQLRDALRRLPEEQRSAIVQAFFGGLTYEQVARRQAIPIGTAKTRIRLGMQHLRDLLRSNPGGGHDGAE